jgi:TIR domain-containing protein
LNAGPSDPTSVPGPKVFITYRREETAIHAGRLYDSMVVRFGEGNVFMDVDMAPGVDFVERINEAVAACQVLIVVMGPRWATVEDEEGNRRLADPEDFVRLEVEAALRRPEVTPIPVLVAGARMPNRQDLPEELRPITRRNALELSDLRWRQDVGRLISTLDELLAETPRATGPAPPEPAIAAGRATPAGAPPRAKSALPPTAAGSPSAEARPAASLVAGGRRLRWALLGAIAIAAIVVAVLLATGGGGSSTPAHFTKADLRHLVLSSESPPAQNLVFKPDKSGGGQSALTTLAKAVGANPENLPSSPDADIWVNHWDATTATGQPQAADSAAIVFNGKVDAQKALASLGGLWQGPHFEKLSDPGLGEDSFAVLLNGSSRPEYQYAWRTGNLVQYFHLYSSSTSTPVNQGTARESADNMERLVADL